MGKRYYLWLVGLTIAVLLIRFGSLKDSQITHAQEIALLSPPYFGTTTVWNIFDHEYPNYNGIPPGDITDMVHNDNQELNPPVHQGGPGNIYCTGYSGHDGIDYGLYYKYVRAAHGGNVFEAGWDNPNHQLDFGLHVRLRTTVGGVTYETVYGHLSAILVKTNEATKEGNIIAISGDTGNSTGPHLHFTVRRPGDDGAFYEVNPYGWNGAPALDPWDQLPNRPSSVDLWESYPSIEFYSTCTQLPYPDGPEIPYPVPGDPPLVPTITAPPFTTIIDNSDTFPRFTVFGVGWTQQTCVGLPVCYGTSYHTSPRNYFTGTYARYVPYPDELIPGQYDLYAYNPNITAHGNANLAHYYISHNNQLHFAGFDQQYFNKPPDYQPKWAYLGRYDFAGGGQEQVVVYHEGGAGENLSADALVFVFVDGPADIEEQITVGTDDAGMDPFPCTFNEYGLTREEIYFGYCISTNTPVISGLRFSGIDIPVGGVIKRAHIQFFVDDPEDQPSGTIHLRIYGERSPNSPTFSNNNQPGNRTLTQSWAAWDVPYTVEWVWYQKRYSPNLAPVVQEIVNLPGWVYGNSALTFILKPNPSYPIPPPAEGRSRRVMAYERDQPPAGVYDAHLLIWLQCSTPPCPGQ